MTVLGLHHVGFTVPDMDEAVAFFTEMFGAVTIMECGAVDVDDDFMRTRLGVPQGCRISDQRVLQVGRGGSLEVFEYTGVNDPRPIKHNGEVGAMHIAFEVDDAFEVAGRLKANGVDVLEGPTLIKGGPMDQLVWMYLRAPWGQYLEIVSSNGPLGYEADGGPKLWTPSVGH
ncbi:MAG: VOC family protein [Roseitalea sp.]|jgi:catechol 2,3-dioxygenase-like lactoylglutathione lyase family enzyme|nr:VOC family protein [Roseitalea sp.]MBO6720601.1 VOC family protein [Roseitalea sp.]MBO6743748.1 VOC family protein [Roseitalea sp.]